MSDITRSLHTVKGLSGMVGLTGAAGLAHAMEECVRSATRDSGQLDQKSIVALIAGVQTLEAFIAAYRTGSPMPDASAVLQDLQASEAPLQQLQTLRFTFSPAAEIAA